MVKAIVCTHAHNDHINAAAELAERWTRRSCSIRRTRSCGTWSTPDRPYTPLKDGQVLSVGGVELTVLHTPGHAPGAVCLYSHVGAVFGGDTLFKGGPGATGRSFSSFETIIDSIRERLLTLPGETAVHTGHGDSTLIAEEAKHLEEWLARGH